jgi:hypothetical protein
MAKKKKNKSPEPLIINAPFAYFSAIDALQTARAWAHDHQDYNALINIATAWSEIGGHLLTAEIEMVYDDDEVSATSAHKDEPIAFGFTGEQIGKETIKPTDNAS